MNRRLIAAIGTAALLFSVAACSSSSKSTATSGSSSTSASGKTLTVWLMTGDNPAGWVSSVTADFKAANPGVKLNIQIQQWTNIVQKVTAALSQNNPPDVIDIGNTQTPYYAAAGGLMDITALKSALGGDGWTASMNGSAVYNGKQYAAPWYAGGRAVMYNKKLWAAAGLTSTPTTMAEYISDLNKLKTTSGVQSALYLPGQYWYFFDGLLQQAGANIATQSGGTWTGTLSSPAALAAAQQFKTLQAYGTAPKDQTETNQDSFFEKGNVATMIAMGYEQATIAAAAPSLANEIGWFPIPSDTAGTPGKTFLGGSNLAISAKSQNATLAQSFLKIALDQKNESMFAKDSGFLPNTSADYSALAGNAYAEAYEQAAPEAGYTPLVPTWANVENAPNPITTLFLTPVLEGKSPASSAAAADAQIATRLNQQQ
ncbi:extracellular solute-binding protein [Streptacidiphilus sp. PB12-B1b]|uniref:extracellular solute-binding protein n=1 Tax=Streptacidiphilus sp. PB12-B1b TaxID=2705012 RepID=UPI0015FA2EF7|nr:extracellular solute-binding protein [Streptacidiphilus sp. PB12-B1b]QMU79211.1 extracellular solute-binding protein [Streptacidiphilus sp. PB12-B1b]